MHFVGIGGIGMSGIAQVFVNQGYEVSGSDIADSDSSKKLARMGVVMSPPMPAFYSRPQSLNDMVDYSVTRLLDQLGIHLDVNRWSGDMTPPPKDSISI